MCFVYKLSIYYGKNDCIAQNQLHHLHFLIKQYIYKKIRYHQINSDNTELIDIMGRTKGIEPSHDGTTTRCVNHFTTFAMYQAGIIIP